MAYHEAMPHAPGLLSLIGSTPLVELRRLAPKPGVRLFAKLEGQNPSGSVKDRIALAMVDAAERAGRLAPGRRIVEASTGNTAIALAMVAKQRGYPLTAVVPEGVIPTIKDMLRLYGAEVVDCPPQGGMRRAIEIAGELAARENGVALSQFTNAANVGAHYGGTGAELLGQVERIDVFVAGIGTGGTVMGVGRRLREANPGVRIIGVEPRLGERLQGLRSLEDGYVPPLLDLSMLDGRFIVDSAEAIACARRIVEEEGLFAGVSSGAALSAALRIAERLDEAHIVVMFADGGWKYLPARPWNAPAGAREHLDEVHWW